MSVQRGLGILLAIQVVLVAIAWWPSDPGASRLRPAIDIDRDAITQIEIALRPVDGAEPKPAILVKRDDGWIVRSAADYPAKQTAVDELLGSLLGLTTGPPIATSVASHDALKVSEAEYGRRIRIATAGVSVVWLVGAATSNSVNLRREGEDDVYRATGSGEWSFRESSSSYYDTNLVDVDPSTLASVVVRNANGEIRFEQADGVWKLSDVTDAQASDAEKISGFLASVAKLRLTQPVGTEALPEYGLGDAPRVDWTVASNEQSISGGYAVGAEIEGDRYVQVVGRPFVVRARKSALSRLLDAKPAEFVREAPGEPEAPGSE